MRSRKMGEVQASMTIYLLLMLLVLLSLTFTLLESARVHALKIRVQLQSEQELESVFAQYHRELLSAYHLFGYEAETHMLQSQVLPMNSMSGDAFDLLGIQGDQMQVEEYELLTDDGGAPFRAQAAQCVKMEAVGDVTSQLLAYLEQAKDKSAQEQLLQQQEEQAYAAIEQIEEEKKAQAEQKSETENPVESAGAEGTEKQENQAGAAEIQNQEESAETTEDAAAEKLLQDYGNPLQILSQLKANGILAVVMEDSSTVSANTISGQTLLKDRTLQTGTATQGSRSQGEKLAEEAAFTVYLNKYFSDYTAAADGHALAYEKEYIIAGKDTDQENLKSIVHRLLLLREACNYGTICQDREKCELAQGLATAIAGATGLEALILPMKMGILLAWAYGESILDVRTLLAGGKVSFVKQPTEWSLELENFGDLLNTKKKASESEKGIGYVTYLNVFLLMQAQEEQTMRTLSLMEQTIRKSLGNEQFCMDRLIQSMKVSCTYHAKPLFLSMVSIAELKSKAYSFPQTVQYSYLVQ